jgi:hypothetical protein
MRPPRRFDLPLTNKHRGRSTLLLWMTAPTRTPTIVLSGRLYSFTLSISGHCIGEDIDVENQLSRILRFAMLMLADLPRRHYRKSVSVFKTVNEGFNSNYPLTEWPLKDQSSLIIKPAENTAGVLSRPHPSTLYYTRNTAFGTAYNNALTSSPPSDQTTQISRTKFLITAMIPGAVLCGQWNKQTCRFLMLILFRTHGTQGPPTDNADHGSCISIVLLVLCSMQFLSISLPTTPTPHLPSQSSINQISNHIQHAIHHRHPRPRRRRFRRPGPSQPCPLRRPCCAVLPARRARPCRRQLREPYVTESKIGSIVLYT